MYTISVLSPLIIQPNTSPNTPRVKYGNRKDKTMTPSVFLPVVHVSLRQVGLDRQDVLRDQPPDRNVSDLHRLEEPPPAGQKPAPLRRIDEHLELHDARALDDGPPERVHEFDRRAQRPPRRHQVVYDEDPIPILDPVLLDCEAAPLSVLGVVRVRRYRVGHLPPLAHHDERHLEGQRDGRAEHEAAGVDAGDGIDRVIPPPGIPRHEDVHDLLEYLRLGEESADVVKSRYALEGVVGQVLGDLAGLVAVLLVCFFNRGHVVTIAIAIAVAFVVDVFDAVDVYGGDDVDATPLRRKTVRGMAALALALAVASRR